MVVFANPGNTEAPFVEAAERHGFTIEKIPWGRHKPILSSALRIKRLLKKYNAQILHTHNWYADYVGAAVRYLHPVKLVTTVYVWADYDFKRNVLQAIDKWALRGYDMITAHCEDTLHKTHEMGFKPEKVRLQICGFESNAVGAITPEERRTRRAQHGIQNGEVVLANIARFYPEKIQDQLLRSFAAIHKRHPHARLWMLGVGPLEQELRALCTQLGLDEYVTWHGFVEDLPGILPLIDIQVHPSRMEGVALSICSGMAAGLPIVASDVGGLKEVLKTGQTGVLLPTEDEQGFIEAVCRLIEQPEEARRLGDNARRFIENDYSLAKAVHDLETTYEEMLR
jgi:glycosyltransferase involved in cell wall biosynthesis